MKNVSKSHFIARALDLFRQVERTGKPIIITDQGTPVLRVVPYHDNTRLALSVLRNSVVKYRSPTKPIANNEWDAAR